MGSGFLQLPIPLDHHPQLRREDFLVSASNRSAFDMIEAWPDWPNRVVILIGPPGAGKTHLVNIWSEQSGAVQAKLPSEEPVSKPLYIENIDAEQIDETALFHLINAVAESGRHLLLTARTPVTDWAIRLPDLLSRLRLATPVHLNTPDDTLLRQVLVKLFSDRQLLVDKPVIDYLLKRMERSLAAAGDLVNAIDREALSENRRISRHLAARVLDRTNDAPGLLEE